jgi:hypothetical protein
LTEKIFGCLTAPDMELINRSEIVDRYGNNRFTKGLDPTPDCSSQVAMRVVIGYILLSWHCPPPDRCNLVSLPIEQATANVAPGQKRKLAQLNSMSVLPSTADIGGMMPHVRLGALKPEHHCHHCGAKMPHLHHDLCVHPAAPTGQGQANDSSVP